MGNALPIVRDSGSPAWGLFLETEVFKHLANLITIVSIDHGDLFAFSEKHASGFRWAISQLQDDKYPVVLLVPNRHRPSPCLCRPLTDNGNSVLVSEVVIDRWSVNALPMTDEEV